MRRRVEHAGVEIFHEISDILRQELYVWYLAELQLHQKIFFDHLVDHIVGGADHVVIRGIVLYYGVHFLVGIEVVAYHRIPCLFIKGVNKLGIDVVSEVVYVDNSLLADFSRS